MWGGDRSSWLIDPVYRDRADKSLITLISESIDGLGAVVMVDRTFPDTHSSFKNPTSEGGYVPYMEEPLLFTLSPVSTKTKKQG